MVIAWDEPETDGGCPITEYKVEKCDAVKQAFFSAGQLRLPTNFKNVIVQVKSSMWFYNKGIGLLRLTILSLYETFYDTQISSKTYCISFRYFNKNNNDKNCHECIFRHN